MRDKYIAPLEAQYGVSFSGLNRVRKLKKDLANGHLEARMNYGDLMRLVFPTAANARNRFTLAKEVNRQCKIAGIYFLLPYVFLDMGTTVDTAKELDSYERMFLRGANDANFRLAIQKDLIPDGKEHEWYEQHELH